MVRAILLGALLCGVVVAGEDPTVEDLARRNAELEKRVDQLEKSALAEDIDHYLRDTDFAAQAEGGTSLLPGGLSIAFSGEVRVRGEVRDHNYAPGDPDGQNSFNFVHMRTRLRADIDVLENLAVIIELQDVRIWGAEGSTVAAVTGATLKGFDLKRGIIHFKNVGGVKLDVELGRYVMFYGDQRLVGHLEWLDQGRSYDGLRALFHPESGWWVDFFAVNVRETMAANDDRYFTGFYGGNDWIEAYVMLLIDDLAQMGEIANGKTRYVTMGFRIHRRTGNWDYSVEVPFQVGDLRGDDLQAYAGAATVGYTFLTTAWRPRVSIEVAYASGDANPADGDNGQFQTLFPTNHLWYGWMDLVGWNNIINLRVHLVAKPTEKITLMLDYHHFWRPEDQGAWQNAGGGVIRPGAANTSPHLGDEIDFQVMWKPNKPLSFLAGYAIFLPGSFVSQTGQDPIAHFFYLQARAKF